MPFETVMMYVYSIPNPWKKNKEKTLDLSNDPKATIEMFKGL